MKLINVTALLCLGCIREHLDAHSVDEAEAGRNAKSNWRTNGMSSSMASAWSSCPMTTWRGASRERTLSLARCFP
jgi:hypothetical protein